MVQNLVKEKYCSCCKKEQSPINYHRDTGRPDGLHPWCKNCVKLKRAKHYKANKQKIKKQVKDYAETKKGSLIKRYSCYKNNSKSRNLEFSLSIENLDILFTQECHYCGTSNYITMGIDRKDNNIGYIISNCLPCCSVCNYMKQGYSYNDFINKCIIIAKRLG